MRIKGRVARIIHTEQNGICKFAFDTVATDVIRQSDGTVLCTAFMSQVFASMPVILVGEWNNGIFECSEVEFTWIDERTMAEYLLSCFKGKNLNLGKKKIFSIVTTYGKELCSIQRLDFEKRLRMDFPSLNEKQIFAILDALFVDNSVLQELEALFSKNHIEHDITMAVYSKYQKESIKMLQKNAYAIGYEFDIRFNKVDDIAISFGTKMLDQHRLEGMISYCLKNAANAGHTYVNANVIAKMVSHMAMNSLFGEPMPPICIATAVINSNMFILDGEKLAFKKYYLAEKNIAKRLKAIKSFESHIKVNDQHIDDVAKRLNFKFGTDQRHSFKLLETGGVNILTGGPGTGKTTVIKGIVQYYLDVNPGAKIVFCAPTGRAAKRLAESVGYEAKTIHKTLEYLPYAEDVTLCKNAANPIEADFIIVDECSMVEAELMSLLLSAVKTGTRLLLVGDENQLPSIGAGNVLHDLIASKIFPVYRLLENFRQANGGSIHENGDRILAGLMPEKKKDFLIYKATNEQDAFEGLCFFMNRYYDMSDPFKTQLIEPSKKGIAGTIKMNQYTHESIVHKDLDHVSATPMVNDKVIFTRTDTERGYVNGDIGIIKSMDSEEIVIWNDLEEICIPLSSMIDITLAYAYTIHKSQGSENPIVIIYLPKSMAHMMTRSLLYTAVTRARILVIIIYTEDALELCIQNTSDIQRNTRLYDFLCA